MIAVINYFKLNYELTLQYIIPNNIILFVKNETSTTQKTITTESLFYANTWLHCNNSLLDLICVSMQSMFMYC